MHKHPQKPILNHPLKVTKEQIGYAQKDNSLIEYQITKYRINEISEFDDAYIANYLTHATSETMKNIYCVNLIKQHGRECKAEQKKFQIVFSTSLFTETEEKLFFKNLTSNTQN